MHAHCWSRRGVSEREVGDQNNKTFHNTIRNRQAQNTIREIRCQDGTLATTQEDIKMEAERFFSEFLNLNPSNYQGVSEEGLKGMLDFRCTLGDISMLEAEVTEEEIRKVLFAMPAKKSPGPDGYPVSSLKTTWSIIAHDFIVAIQSVFRFGFFS